MKTQILPVAARNLGHFAPRLEQWHLHDEALVLKSAGSHLRCNQTPIAFPTETVYGLGADATRSDAVRGIYAAKGRPSDNPLIVHVCDLAMLRSLAEVPAIYTPLLEKFWPGPLTILLPLPTPSPLAPEVSAGLKTFGVRMPSSPLALSLIKLAGVPIAAPSANASTKPSPTKAEHVLHDLDGRIEYIIDGGDCEVGVESTVVDGLCDPPAILRPGGVSLEELRKCAGWERVTPVYKDQSEESKPRAPGMKYKHYSPKAKVVLYERTTPTVSGDGIIGVVWTRDAKDVVHKDVVRKDVVHKDVIEIFLGPDPKDVAHGLFSTLRYLDQRGASVIHVEGITGGDLAAAVMNRLRKAASEIR